MIRVNDSIMAATMDGYRRAMAEAAKDFQVGAEGVVSLQPSWVIAAVHCFSAAGRLLTNAARLVRIGKMGSVMAQNNQAPVIDVHITGAGVLDASDGMALRQAQGLDEKDITAGGYRFTISPEVKGFSCTRDDNFFSAFLGKSVRAFMERRKASDSQVIADREFMDKIFYGHFHVNSIEGDSDRAANLTSTFIHSLHGCVVGVAQCYQRIDHYTREDHPERAAPFREILNQLTRGAPVAG